MDTNWLPDQTWGEITKHVWQTAEEIEDKANSELQQSGGGMSLIVSDLIDSYAESIRALADLYDYHTDREYAEFVKIVEAYRGHANGTRYEMTLNRAVNAIANRLSIFGEGDPPDWAKWGHFYDHPLHVLQGKWPLLVPQIMEHEKKLHHYATRLRSEMDNADLPNNYAMYSVARAHCISATSRVKWLHGVATDLTNTLSSLADNEEHLSQHIKDLCEYIKTGKIG